MTKFLTVEDSPQLAARNFKYLAKKNMFNYRFDFEIGYLIKSPCKECDKKNNFPECADACKILDEIHGILSKAVSCSKSV